MKRMFAMAALLAVATVPGAAKDKPKESVNYAPSWEAAVEEAKFLNVPIVVHSHGFYWGPCWGVHGSVLQNKKYIKFAEENTVEVMAMSRLSEGIEKGDRRAATYTAKDAEGNEVEYLVEFPGLTVEQINSMNSSKAGSYNNTGRIPYTAIVNPHTLAEMSNIAGGYGVGALTDAVEDAKKALIKEYGPSLSRKDLAKLDKQISEIREDTAEANFVKAFGGLNKLEKSVAKEPEQVQAKVAAVKTEVVEAAGKKLDELEGMIGSGEAKAASRELGSLTRALKGTDLEERAKELLDKAKSA